MGFFSELKEDLSQAVTELTPEELEAEKTENAAPETADDLSKMLDNMDLDQLANAEAESDTKVNGEENVEVGATEETVEQEVYEPRTEKLFAGSVASSPVADENSIITLNMTVKGDITSQGSLEVIGNVVGNIDVMGKLNVTGSVTGNSKAAEFYAEKARINGEVHSEGSLKIGQSSIIIGNVFGTSAVIAGAVKGDIDVHGPVILDASAIVMGNIKSKSVQINNGAVIEGMCSQCYADVNPTSFFENVKKSSGKNK